MWNNPNDAPKDGRLILLLLKGGEHNTENEIYYRSIGHNLLECTGEDRWNYAGWCWSHDHWTEGFDAKVVGWLPLPEIRLMGCADYSDDAAKS